MHLHHFQHRLPWQRFVSGLCFCDAHPAPAYLVSFSCLHTETVQYFMDPGIGAGGALIHYTRRQESTSLVRQPERFTDSKYPAHVFVAYSGLESFLPFMRELVAESPSGRHQLSHSEAMWFIAFSFCITFVVFAANLVGMHHMLTTLWAASNRVGANVVHTGRALAPSIRTSWGGLGERSQHGEAAAASQQRTLAIVTTGTSASTTRERKGRSSQGVSCTGQQEVELFAARDDRVVAELESDA